MDREKVISEFERWCNEMEDECPVICLHALALLKEQEAVVRCKDCKYWDADEHDCNIKIGWFACGADWFCADGERKSD